MDREAVVYVPSRASKSSALATRILAGTSGFAEMSPNVLAMVAERDRAAVLAPSRHRAEMEAKCSTDIIVSETHPAFAPRPPNRAERRAAARKGGTA